MTGRTIDYYEVLEISCEASPDEIRQAYRKLARQYHPDLAVDKAVAEEKFKQINQAYEVLGNLANRRRYDASFGRRGRPSLDPTARHANWAGAKPKPDFRPYTETSEFRSFYEHYFGRDTQRARDPNRDRSSARAEWPGPIPQRGKDLCGEIRVPVKQVFAESVHTISVVRRHPGTQMLETRSLHLKLPAGLWNGQVLRLAGKGDYGRSGGSSGDLYLTVRIVPDGAFRIQGADLHCDLEVNVQQAVLGGWKRIQCPDGSALVRIPPRTRTGHRLRIRGKGLATGQGGRGDLYAVVSVKQSLGSLRAKIKRLLPERWFR